MTRFQEGMRHMGGKCAVIAGERMHARKFEHVCVHVRCAENPA